MTLQGKASVAVWVAFLAACLWMVTHANYTADLSAFLPSTPTQEQQLLIDQLKSGIASRLILISIEGGDQAARARASLDLAAKLRADPRFLQISNGETQGLDRDREVLFGNRYALSPAVEASRFSVDGLRVAVQASIDQLATSTGLFTKSLLVRDPTSEFMQIIGAMGNGYRPPLANGVWASRDGRRALLLARTRAEGADTDGQAEAVSAIQTMFAAAAGPGMQLALTGPGPFSVKARAAIKSQVIRLSGIGGLIIVSLLVMVYRSPMALLLGLLPVLSGALAGAAAVGLGFGVVHGITLGFGAALIGEAVDYSIYLFTQSELADTAVDDQQNNWTTQSWPTVRIGVLTSVAGFASLLMSSFPGLAQLGLYAIAGLVTAAMVTRFVLPHLLPRKLRVRDLSDFGRRLLVWVQRARRLRWPVLGLFVAACTVLAVRHDGLWNRELAALSPVSQADQALDATMRADLGAPDVRYLVVVTAANQEAVLATSERVAAALRPLQRAGVIDGFENPATYLPSQTTQRARLASLPADAELRRRFGEAIGGLPVKPEHFEPFFSDVAKARTQRPLTQRDIEGTSMAEGVDALMLPAAAFWTALLPLRVAADQQLDQDRVRTALAGMDLTSTDSADVHFVDLKGESDRLYAGYLHEAILLSLGGLGAILGLLLIVTRSLVRVFRIAAPLVAAVVVVIAGLVIAGQQLTLLHLVGMLLVVAVGSNYALFFDRATVEGGMTPRILASLPLAVSTTVAGFGILSFSSVPVLSAIGSTVGPGAVLALAFSAILARRT